MIKLPRKNRAKRKLIKKRRFNLIKGKVGFGVIAVLFLVGIISIGLVFGIRQLSPYTTSELANYLCCLLYTSRCV